MNAIELTGITKHFNKLTAVDKLDLTVKSGEIFGIVGPDGAGKTTAIRILATILKSESGSGKVLGYDLSAEADKIKASIGYMSQRFTLYQDLSVLENLEFFADLHGVTKELKEKRTAELLSFSRLDEAVDRRAVNLSGGMKQKLALACTLIHQPKLILLDEPTTGVDPVSRREFWQILHNLNSQGITLVISTPYMDEAQRCDRVAFMDNGKVFLVDSPANILKGLEGKLLDIQTDNPRKTKQVLSSYKGSEAVYLVGESIRLIINNAKSKIAGIRKELTGSGIKISEIYEVAPSMESAFITLIGHRKGSEAV